MPGPQKITTYPWFNGNAEEAVEFYTSVFPGSTSPACNAPTGPRSADSTETHR